MLTQKVSGQKEFKKSYKRQIVYLTKEIRRTYRIGFFILQERNLILVFANC